MKNYVLKKNLKKKIGRGGKRRMEESERGDLCPVCLDPLEREDSSLMRMPDCNHCLHTRCALEAATYSTSCPVCRTSFLPEREGAGSGEEGEEEVSTNEIISQILSAHRRRMSRYRRRIRAEMGRSEKGKRLYDMLLRNRRESKDLTFDLNREWSLLERRMWNEDEAILDLKRKRRLAMKRASRYERELSTWIRETIGEEPYLELSLNASSSGDRNFLSSRSRGLGGHSSLSSLIPNELEEEDFLDA